jgi:hypothetical protein
LSIHGTLRGSPPYPLCPKLGVPKAKKNDAIILSYRKHFLDPNSTLDGRGVGEIKTQLDPFLAKYKNRNDAIFCPSTVQKSTNKTKSIPPFIEITNER